MPLMTRASLRLIVLVFLGLSSGGSYGKDCGEKADPCGKPTEWTDVDTVRLRMSQEAMATLVNWSMQTSRANYNRAVLGIHHNCYEQI